MKQNRKAASSGTRLLNQLRPRATRQRKDFSSRILVNGGGIAGLTAALCLARQGFTVDVYEKAEGFEPLGAGIQVSPNAFAVMHQIGLGEDLREKATSPDGIRVHRARSGKVITTIPLGLEAIKRYGFPYLAIHRADLQDILFEHCDRNSAIKVHFSSEIVDYEPHANGLTANVKHQNEFLEQPAKGLVLADGVHSILRTRKLEIEPPKFQSKIAWRALIHGKQLPKGLCDNHTHLWLGSNAHAVAYPVKQGEWTNIVAITRANDLDVVHTATKQVIARQFRSWNAEFRQLFDTEARWTGWPLYAAPSPNRLADGPVAAIGDAAHTMLPFAAQGAAMAIEDASILATCLKSEPDTAIALKSFEQKRLKRLKQVMGLSTKNGKIYHMGFLGGLARNMLMQSSKPENLLKRQDWIYEWRP